MGEGGGGRDSGTGAARRVAPRGERESRRRGLTRGVAGLGRKEALLARRRELQLPMLVARRRPGRRRGRAGGPAAGRAEAIRDGDAAPSGSRNALGRGYFPAFAPASRAVDGPTRGHDARSVRPTPNPIPASQEGKVSSPNLMHQVSAPGGAENLRTTYTFWTEPYPRDPSDRLLDMVFSQNGQ